MLFVFFVLGLLPAKEKQALCSFIPGSLLPSASWLQSRRPRALHAFSARKLAALAL